MYVFTKLQVPLKFKIKVSGVNKKKTQQNCVRISKN